MSRLRRAARQTSGAVMLNFALVLIPLVGGVGLAIDGGRAMLLRYQFQAALDAAGLAVGATIGTPEELDALADAFVAKNFRAPGATILSVNVTSDADKVYVRGQFRMTTFLMGLFSHQNVTLGASTDVKRAGGGLMVALVLDNTGSMWTNGNIASLRDASASLVSKLFEEETDHPDLRVSIVPYAASVNPGAEAENIVNPATLPERDPADKTKWKGCVRERAGAASIADTDTVTGGWWEPFLYPVASDNNFNPADPTTIIPGGASNTNGVTGPNTGCPTPILPLTGLRSEVDASIAAITAWNRGGTLTDIGIAWGLRTLSPEAPFTQSSEADPEFATTLWASPRWRRAMVIMTDGDSLFYNLPSTAGPNTTHPSASDETGYGRLGETLATSVLGTSNANTAKTVLNTRIENLCTQAKAQNIVVYTVVFTSSVSESVRAMYQRCASDPGKYWYAPTKDALNASFSQIGSDLSRLRITK
jgi:Flp pilus assembly protein TadG